MKLVKESLNEGSYDEFMNSYGTQLSQATHKLNSIRDRIKNGEIPEESAWEELDKLNMYDEAITRYIENAITGNENVSSHELAQASMENYNRTGTEMQMIIQAIEEIKL